MNLLGEVRFKTFYFTSSHVPWRDILRLTFYEGLGRELVQHILDNGAIDYKGWNYTYYVAKSKVCVALQGKKVIGWSFCLSKRGKPAIWVYVSRKYRRNGIGSILFAQARKHITTKTFSVSRHNLVAKRFFNKVLTKI